VPPVSVPLYNVCHADSFLDGKRHGKGLAGNEFGFTKVDNSDDYLKRRAVASPLHGPLVQRLAARRAARMHEHLHTGLPTRGAACHGVVFVQWRRGSYRAHRPDGWRVLAAVPVDRTHTCGLRLAAQLRQCPRELERDGPIWKPTGPAACQWGQIVRMSLPASGIIMMRVQCHLLEALTPGRVWSCQRPVLNLKLLSLGPWFCPGPRSAG
jgi:hypothetical protein